MVTIWHFIEFYCQVLGNKTENHVRTFFINYRKRYNLDSVLKDYEKDNGAIVVEDGVDDKVDLDDSNDTSSDVICLSPTPPNNTKKETVAAKDKTNKVAQGGKWWHCHLS